MASATRLTAFPSQKSWIRHCAHRYYKMHAVNIQNTEYLDVGKQSRLSDLQAALQCTETMKLLEVYGDTRHRAGDANNRTQYRITVTVTIRSTLHLAACRG